MKFRERNRLGGTSGLSRVSISTGIATTARAPITSAAQAIGSCQARSCPRVALKASPSTPMATIAAPIQSKRPVASSSRLSGTSALAHSAIADERHAG